MKKITYLAVGVVGGYVFKPYIKKAIDWVKGEILKLNKKLEEATKEEEPQEPDEEE